MQEFLSKPDVLVTLGVERGRVAPDLEIEVNDTARAGDSTEMAEEPCFNREGIG